MAAVIKGIYIGPDNKVAVRTWHQQYKPVGGQALVKVEYSGINPADLKHGEEFGLNDNVCGYEFCGTILETGPSCTFDVGDVIFGSNATNKNRPRSHGAHQSFAIAEDGHMWLRLPSGVPHSHAAVLSIMVRTAADALFNAFGIPLPGEGGSEAAATIAGPILIWGGATSVGTAAIQLAKAAGISTILTTASAKNHHALLRLGATECFDYHDPQICRNIQRSLEEGGQPLRYVFDTVVTRGPDSSTAKCEAIPSTAEVKYACVLPVFGNPKWQMVVASRAFDFPSPGGFAKAQPDVDVLQQKATTWAVTNYGKGFTVPNVRVVKDVDEVIEAIEASARGKLSFEKVAIQHPL